MARAQVWRRNKKEKNRRRRDKSLLGFFLEDLDALYAEYRSFQRFPSSDFQTVTPQLARPSVERQALAARSTTVHVKQLGMVSAFVPGKLLTFDSDLGSTPSFVCFVSGL